MRKSHIKTIDWAHSSDSSGQFRMFIIYWFIFVPELFDAMILLLLAYLLFIIIYFDLAIPFEIAFHYQNNRNSSSIFNAATTRATTRATTTNST